MSNIYIINDISYSKNEIDENEELKTELLKMLKKDHYKIVCKETSKLYRQANKEKINNYNKEYQRNKYAINDEYRENRLKWQKEYINKKCISDGVIKKPKGRPSKFMLNENFELMAV